jgi:putative membrane protein
MLLNNKIPIVYSLSKIKPELFVVSIYAIGIVFFHDYIHVEHMSIPIAIPSLLGTTISLILGFRISQSYDRWWEARKIWGEIVNDSRTLVRQALTFIQDNENPERSEQMHSDIVKTQIGFVYALGRSLRGQDTRKVIEDRLSQEELKEVLKEDNVPNAILKLHAKLLKEAIRNEWVSGFHVIQIDDTITRLTAAMGKAERIKNTIFPITYTLLVEFLLYLFVMLLPLGLTDYFGYMVAPLLIVISVPFFLLEKTAINLQNPFNNNKTDIPVITIARNIEMNLNQMIGKEFKIEGKNPEDGSFYVM